MQKNLTHTAIHCELTKYVTVQNVTYTFGRSKSKSHFTAHEVITSLKSERKTLQIQCVPLATEPGIFLIILTPMKILQRNLNRSTFVVWEMKRNVSEQRSASQPACFLPDAPLCWSLCHLPEGAYIIRLLFVSVSVCVSSHRIHFKFRCNFLISGKIIKEIPGSVASGTHCISTQNGHSIWDNLFY